jgi:hypothetical protein
MNKKINKRNDKVWRSEFLNLPLECCSVGMLLHCFSRFPLYRQTQR